jgi:hypothetical protein
MIDTLVTLRTLRIAVEDQHFAERTRPDHRNILECGGAGIIDFLDGMVVVFRRREFFDVPLPELGFGHYGLTDHHIIAG